MIVMETKDTFENAPPAVSVYAEMSDDRLYQQYCEKHECGAMEELIRRHQDFAFRAALHVTGNHHRAEEADVPSGNVLRSAMSLGIVADFGGSGSIALVG